MKTAAAILLFLFVTSHVTLCFYAKHESETVMKTAGEEDEKTKDNEKKEVPECIACHPQNYLYAVHDKPEFTVLSVSPPLSPVIEHLTPPPDVA